ncbi:DUF433 domain-containing protein [Niveispirillum sp. KHB5.9]|uniref:DUF433 domain-containing protein n=1 Tax=Niveispirillum sp. KHB5.9 TaxID=3400269 RepID=UPI003A87109C
MSSLDTDSLSPHEAVFLAMQAVEGVRVGTGEVALDAALRTARYMTLRRRYLVSDQSIRGGSVILRGTRITAASVAARIDYGEALGEIAAESPEIPSEAFEAALIFAKAQKESRREQVA